MNTTTKLLLRGITILVAFVLLFDPWPFNKKQYE